MVPRSLLCMAVLFWTTPVSEGWTFAPHRRSAARTSALFSRHDASGHDAVGYGSENEEASSAVSGEQSRRDWMTGMVKMVVVAPLVLPSVTNAIPALVTSSAVCDPTVSVWKEPRRNRLVYILGTAHISQVSADLAGQLVRDVHPDAVFVELDLKRVGGVGPGRPQIRPAASVDNGAPEPPVTMTYSTPKTEVIVPGVSSTTLAQAYTSPSSDVVPAAPESSGPFGQRALNFGAAAIGSAMRNMYKNLGKAGFQPGEEFVAAVKEAQAMNIPVVLGDQDVEYTLRRLYQALAATDLNKLLNDKELEQKLNNILPGPGTSPPQLPSGAGKTPDAYKEELTTFVEKMKSRETVRQIMGQLKEAAPALVQVMLTERDAYMAMGIDTLNQFECVVAVMGLAHVDGVENNLRQKGWQPVAPRCPAK